MKALTQLLTALIFGSYAFTAAGYVFTWVVYQKVRETNLEVTNHHETRLKRLEKKLERWERDGRSSSDTLRDR